MFEPDYNPFAETPDVEVRQERVAKPSRWQKQANGGDGGVSGRPSSPSKKRKINHNDRTREFWQKSGYRYERLESLRNINGFSMKADFCGIADGIATRKGENGPEVVFVQVVGENAASSHFTKMTSSDTYRSGASRIDALIHYLSIGIAVVIQSWRQPGGYGKSWESVEYVITEGLVAKKLSGDRISWEKVDRFEVGR